MAEILRMWELQRRCLLYSQLKKQQLKESNGGRLEDSSQYEAERKKVIKHPGVLELKQNLQTYVNYSMDCLPFQPVSYYMLWSS